MDFVFYVAVVAVVVLAFRPLKEASAYRFRNSPLVLEGLAYLALALWGWLAHSWWPLIAAGILSFFLFRRRKR